MLFNIKEFKRNPFDIERYPDDTNPQALYTWEVSDGSGWSCHCGGAFSEYEPLLSYFKIASLSELKGRTIDLPNELNPRNDTAMEFIVLTALHGGKYVPPEIGTVVDQIIDALAKGQEPDLKSVDNQTRASAASFIFSESGSPFKMSDERIAWLEKQILSREDCVVASLSRTDPEGFPFRVRGAAAYLLLKLKNGENVKFVFGPYSKPVSIVR